MHKMKSTPSRRPRYGPRRFFVAGLVTALLFFVTRGLVTRAGVANFYPGTCLGGWENTQYAQGAPDAVGGDTYSFSRDNSAVLETEIAGPIFCGNFSGDTHDNAPLRNATLRFSLTMSGVPVPAPASEIAAPTSTPSEDPVPVSTSTETSFLLRNLVAKAFAQETESVVPPVVPDPASVPAESPEPAATPAPAGGAAPGELPAPAEAPGEQPPSLEPGLEPSETPSPGVTPPAANSEETAPTEPVIAAPQLSPAESVANSNSSILKVFYTIDGVHWQAIGEIGLLNWQNAAFDIPLTDWSSLSKVQVSLQSVPFSGNKPLIYLDSMLLEANYQEDVATAAAENSKEIATSIGDLLAGIPDGIASAVDAVRDALSGTPQDLAQPAAPSAPTALVPQFAFAPGLALSRVPEPQFGSDAKRPTHPALHDVLVAAADGGEALALSGQCAGSYFTVLLFADPDGYVKDPARAVVNKSVPCVDNRYTYRIGANDLPPTLADGTYYLLVGVQADTGPWTPASPIYPVDIRVK